MMNPKLIGMMVDDRTRELRALVGSAPARQLPSSLLRRRARAARRLLQVGNRRR